MERLKKSRKPIRSQVTRMINECNIALGVEDPDTDALNNKLLLLQKFMESLAEIDDKVKEQQLDDNVNDDEMEAELTSVLQYQEAYIEVKQKIRKLTSPSSPAPSEALQSSASNSGDIHGRKRALQLPTITLKPFDGTLKMWISWWSQFAKVHDDDDVDNSDKFQYLSQAVQEGTEAKELINSYPQTAENYPRAVEALIDRYGRDDLQLQFYVRELLTLVITNVTNKDKLPLSTLQLKLESHLRSLATLKLDQADPASWLFPLVESSLAEDTLRAWQRSPLSKFDGSTTTPTKTRLELLMDFLQSEVRTEQQISLAQSAFQSAPKEKTSGLARKGNTRPIKMKNNEEIATAAGLMSGLVACAFCDGKHDSDRCIKAQIMSYPEKREKVESKRLCFKCLRPGHSAKKCKWTVRCIICSGRHYAVMCQGPSFSKPRDSSQPEGSVNNPPLPHSMNYSQGYQYYEQPPPAHMMPPPQFNVPINDYSKSSSSANQCSSDVLLNTILVNIKGRNTTLTVRLVGDTGSQRSYIRSEVVKRLGCERVGQEWLQNVLFGGVTTPPTLSQKYAVTFINPSTTTEAEFHLLERKEICGQLSKIPNGPWLHELQQHGINISDVGSGCENVDVLLGNDYWGNVLTGRILKLACGLVAVETIFGWTLSGRVPASSSNLAVSVISMLVSSNDVSNLWSLETLGIQDPIETKTKQEDELEAVSHFNKTVTRDKTGRYVVSLPWKCEIPTLPSNRHIAERRLVRATTQLKKQNKFEDYDNVFRSWENEGFISIVTSDNNEGHFLPHRPVFKEGSSTPVRPVFDASCKAGRSPSLNDVMHTGPNLLELIPSLLIRFREKRIGVSADIRKAFQMMLVLDEDKKYQKFLWWDSPTCDKIKVYQHNRVVFGMTCSPFLLAATINNHLDKVEDREFAEQLRTSFYVDNSVSSFSTHDEYEQFRQTAVSVLRSAGMDLRQWATTITTNTSGNSTLPTEEKECIQLLGMLWDRRQDNLYCDVPTFKLEENATKREILSVVSRIFDPIGTTSPAVLSLKLLLQQAVVLKCGWDEPLPEDINEKFRSWVCLVHILKAVKIPRHIQLHQHSSRQIHTFVDGSSYAYAAVVFLRSEYYGEVKIQLVLAKSRLAPIAKTLRKTSIHRLELMACLLGARLANTIRESLTWESTPFHFWSDSTTALAWIRQNDQWGTFVGNRVSEIRKTTEMSQWRHVPGHINPADLPSRGCSPAQLQQSKWWEGPHWLYGSSNTWPNYEIEIDEDSVNVEKKKSAVILATDVFPQPRFSSFRKNVAIWGWVLRFVKCAQTPKLLRSALQTNFLLIHEMREAEKIVLRKIQEESFPKPGHRIGGMVVTVDQAGLLRVQTRLLNRPDKVDFKNPILLPKSHPLVDMLVIEIHRFYGHAGTQFLISKLREKYWVLQTRRTVKRIIRKCTTCRRFQSKPSDTVPAPLPEKRVSNSEPFETTGVDLAGPVYLRDGSKAWIVLFTCAYYSCLHLDIVTSLSTEAFLGALERFICVNGRPNTVYSDNGTNFHGAANIFKSLKWKKIEEECNIRQIQWIFNPPSAAWWGGFWERLVRSIKDLVKRMIGSARLTYDEFRTCLAGVCATINERPLTVVTEDGEDFIPLTPAMFLRLRTRQQMPECPSARSLQNGYKSMKSLQLQLQDRFRKEYLALLVQRGNEKKSSLKAGDVVLVGAENQKRFKWPLGLIMELIPGRDGECRIAKVKTSRGVVVRPLAADLKSSIRKSPEVKVPTPSESVRVVCTKRGRIIKKPARYGQYFSVSVKH